MPRYSSKSGHFVNTHCGLLLVDVARLFLESGCSKFFVPKHQRPSRSWKRCIFFGNFSVCPRRKPVLSCLMHLKATTCMFYLNIKIRLDFTKAFLLCLVQAKKDWLSLFPFSCHSSFLLFPSFLSFSSRF